MKKILMLAAIVVAGTLNAQDKAKNGTFSEWNDEKGAPKYWHSNGGATQEKAIVADGNVSVKVVGRTKTLTQRIRLKAGSYYHLSGSIYSAATKGIGIIGLRDKQYKWKVKLKGPKEGGEWKSLSQVFKADGKEMYLYCCNWYIGDEEAIYYSSISLKEVSEEEAKKALVE